MGFFGREHSGGSGVQMTDGANTAVRTIERCRVMRLKAFRMHLREWTAAATSASGLTNVLFYVAREKLAGNAPPGQCVTLAGRKEVAPFFNLFVRVP
jgi:hypothetical protein